ncbi:hypothetical protein [Novosphingobium sp.]|nr:hypothetical protein [Novosphingobium sp.]MCZ8017672.1 hypothetical protein [Novosphingobium sp.]MCZ8033804.1 hypothetical protein [Novosphingobium sp.]MCZ8051160.1 hypothetical protein [Novosphingobium sp.]MCZ8059506.1 hypothetical protein [Novosphingobium sp.]MCZ8231344.1 hypothetical protein [Novosphingobium sp.]
MRVRTGWLIGGTALLVALAGLLGLAWQDAGKEPLRLIAEPVSLPEVRP